LLLYGWTTHLHWILPVLGGSLFGIGMFTICKWPLGMANDNHEVSKTITRCHR
jgi:hypothetical protein